MKIKPVTHYKIPHYPTKTDTENNPQLLKIIPSRWEKNFYAFTAFGMTLALSACSSYHEEETGTEQEEREYQESSTEVSQKKSLNTKNTAPVFLHGTGSGAYGCVSVTSPYFLSEEEAFDIICAEAESYGNLTFTREDAPVFAKAKIPITNIYMGADGNKVKYKKGDLETDGWNQEKQIAFEFVSKSDVENWYEDSGVWSSVSNYDMIDTAQDLRAGLAEKKNTVMTGIFYDPCSSVYDYGEYGRLEEKFDIHSENPDYEGFELSKEAYEKTIQENSEDDLRLQVRDFIDWLKGQGVI